MVVFIRLQRPSQLTVRLFAAGLFAVGLASCQKPDRSFPEVDSSKLLITLQRSACYGSCPDYKVSIDARGDILFTTRAPSPDPVSGVHRFFSNSDGVVVSGTHRATTDPKQVTALVNQFRVAHFFKLKDVYRASVTDNPTYVVTIDTGHGTKSLVDYVGKDAGMPVSVSQLEDAIDRVAGTKRWIEGTADVIPLLQNEGADFKGELGARLMSVAASRNDVTTMRRLRTLGAPVIGSRDSNPLWAAAEGNGLDALRWLASSGALGDRETLVESMNAAIGQDNEEAFEFLVSQGGHRLIDRDLATQFLGSAAKNGNLRLVRQLLDAGADVRGTANPRLGDNPPLFEAVNDVFASGVGHMALERQQIVDLLLAKGADPRWCAKYYCTSVFFNVSDPVIARSLLKAGADPNFKDEDGEHVLFSVASEDVALELIHAGANLKAIRPADGMTLRHWAEYNHWHRVSNLLSRPRQ